MPSTTIDRRRRMIGKAASYTVNPAVDQPETTFTNDGATGSITFTLPTPNQQMLGSRFYFMGVVDQSIVVQPPVVDTAIVLNDLAADSLAMSTAGQKIGGVIQAECVRTTVGGYQWCLRGTSVGVTYTIAT